MIDNCVFCNRQTGKENKHHLIPKSTHKNKVVKKAYTKEQKNETVIACRDCHSTIHATISEKRLAFYYNTIEKILSHPEVAKFVDWVRTKPYNGRLTIRKCKS